MPSSPRAAAVSVLLAALLVAALSAGPAVAVNDPLWAQQWAPAKIGVPAAWATSTGAGIKIGIVDSGVDLRHQDLQAGKIAANASCLGTGGNPAACAPGGGQDIAGHGTHVAGIAAANKDNGLGIAGVAPGARLVVARVFQGDSADLADVEAGIRWAVDQGARVVNLSLGENVVLGGLLGGGQASLGPALNEAWARGAIPVVASGNAQLLAGAAGYDNVNALVVGATGPDDELASYSVSTGAAKWAIVAPGGNGAGPRAVLSTYWQPGGSDQYGYLQGTSMATPHVSGALALLLASGVSQQRAVELVLATANKSVRCGSTCAGRLDVAAAMAAAGAAPPPPAPAPAAPPTTRATVPPTPATPPTAPGPAPSTAPPPTEPVPETTVPVTEVPEPTASPEPIEVASADVGDGDDVVIPGVLAGLLLLLVFGGSVVARRRAG